MKKISHFTLGIVLFTILIDMIGFGIVIPVLPLYAEGGRFQASSLQLGWLLGMFSLVQLVMAPLIGKLSDQVGRKPVLFLSMICTALGFIIMGAATKLWMLFLARVIAGASGGNIATVQACIADITTPDQRSKSMGLVGAAFGLGFVLGPALGGVLSACIAPCAPFYFAAALALCNALFIAIFFPETLSTDRRAQSSKRTSLAEVFVGSQSVLISTILVAYLASISGFAMMTSLFALFNAKRLGYGVSQTGYLLTYVGVLGILIQGWLLRHLLQRLVEKQLAATGSLILASGLFLLPFCSNFASILGVLVLIALGNGLVTPTLNGLASRCSSPQIQGRVIGLMQASGSLGRFLGPLIAMALVGWDTPAQYGRIPIWVGASLSFIAFCLAVTFPQKKPPPSATDLSPSHLQ
ncbi:MAG: MFS transporter [Candidatus Xiphinematobacter sp.]|nr:MAG: MFS transporter [Candidatus Xiphinematobacter sp.]QQY08907.1 MAG: MFS transporter [Candidatus Xiphinematobacter sp.]QQY09636.1 MAG: MFS transporter [Candidatus Xiphinematobacter sp.]QQY10389.1 MAG: MFS transporter [Candidatus Xiphinematobacter sp.]QQY11122.1 MAG: MFS transporter [Candidatus Xiphinematobacter sp.]